MIHEFGHYLDHQAIGQSGSYESENPNGKLSGIIKAIKATPSYEKWENEVNQEIKFLQDRLNKTTSPTKRNKLINHIKEADYSIRNRELFARAYAQSIARKAGNSTIYRELHRRRRIESPNTIQWSDEEFIPIDKAINDLFIDLGWMK